TSLFADWADLNAADGPVSADALADALLRACDGLSDEVLRALPGTPDDAAATLANSPFADRVEGVYLPISWLESFCAAMRLPIAELDSGWDISDGETVYICSRVMLAYNPANPYDTRYFLCYDMLRSSGAKRI